MKYIAKLPRMAKISNQAEGVLSLAPKYQFDWRDALGTRVYDTKHWIEGQVFVNKLNRNLGKPWDGRLSKVSTPFMLLARKGEGYSFHDQ